MKYNKIVLDLKEKLDIILEYPEDMLYNYYLGYYPKSNKKYLSPFKQERTPSFTFNINRTTNKLYYKCFSTGKFGDIITLIQELNNITYSEAIDKIYNENFKINRDNYSKYNSLNGNNNDIVRCNKSNKNTDIKVIIKDYTQEDIDYWLSYHITIDILVKYDIKPCKQVWLNDNIWYDYNPLNPCYRYLFNNKYKIYKPLETDKRYKWITNCNNIENIQGFKHLQPNRNIIITKSYKDVVICREYLKTQSISFHGENHNINDKVINWLKNNYQNITLLYDNDDSGIKASNKLVKLYNFNNIIIPKDIYNTKDISDYIKNYGINQTIKFFKI